MNEKFKTAWWLPGAHLQTLSSSWGSSTINVPHLNEIFELPDGDFLDLVWVGKANTDGPLVLILHGVNGGIKSPYVVRMLRNIYHLGWQGVLMHFRGCGNKPNRLTRSYHAGDTGDVKTLVNELFNRQPHVPILAVGYSLGANVLLKLLGETAAKNPLKCAIAISTPFELAKTATHLSKGFAQIYQRHLIRALIRQQQQKFQHISVPFNFKRLNTFWQFDHRVTAPLHGFSSAEEYYTQSSSRQYLHNIKIPILILHALNDPFTPLDSIPSPSEVAAQVTLEILPQGGHVGFISGKYPWNPVYWLEQRVINYFKQQLK